MMSGRFLFPRSSAIAFWLLLFTLAAARCARGQEAGNKAGRRAPQAAASKQAAEGMRRNQITTGTTVSARRQVRVSGEILSLPESAVNTGTIQRYLNKADTISSGTMEAIFMTDPETRLLLRPRITIAEGEEGKIDVVRGADKAKSPFMSLSLKPTFQPDGQIRAKTQYVSFDGKTTQTIKNERVIRPGTRRSTYIGMCRQKQDNTYLFLTLDVVGAK